MKATALIPTSLVKRLVVLAAAAALASGGALAQDAQAGISFSRGGSASVDVFCHQYPGANVTRLWATNASSNNIYFNVYIENSTYPHLSGWQGWRFLPAVQSGYDSQSYDLGALVAMRTGVIRVYVLYEYFNGVRWATIGEWTPFQVPLYSSSTYCSA